ncbi:tail fiber protein [soil metagenome]
MPYIGEIKHFAGNFAPQGWAFCDGQILPIAENDALFALIGTTYGGDGQSNLALPDLRGRVPMHQNQGDNLPMGQMGGAETVTLTVNNLPSHGHTYTYQPVASSSSSTQTSPENGFYAGSGRKAAYAEKSAINANMADISLNPSVQTGPAGSANPTPVPILQPFLAVSYIISLYGIFPSQS